jgi:hypothetical protein
MAGKHVIEVPLPDDITPTRDDLEMLEGAFRVLLCVRFGAGEEGEKTLARLEERGWTVRGWPGWVAEARRGTDVERASGRTRCEALKELESLARLDDLVPVT